MPGPEPTRRGQFVFTDSERLALLNALAVSPVAGSIDDLRQGAQRALLEALADVPGLAQAHPLAPESHNQAVLETIHALQQHVAAATGARAVCCTVGDRASALLAAVCVIDARRATLAQPPIDTLIGQGTDAETLAAHGELDLQSELDSALSSPCLLLAPEQSGVDGIPAIRLDRRDWRVAAKSPAWSLAGADLLVLDWRDGLPGAAASTGVLCLDAAHADYAPMSRVVQDRGDYRWLSAAECRQSVGWFDFPGGAGRHLLMALARLRHSATN